MHVERPDPSFALCRILGNDLPPLHSPGQTLRNLRFILDHEPASARCSKIFILNRIVDRERRERLHGLIVGAGHTVDVIEFDDDAYRGLPTALERGDYLTNNNAARNRALTLGLAEADLALPFDGQTFFTAAAWQQLRADVADQPECPVFVVPMVRLLHNREALGLERVHRDEELGPSEPQLMWTRQCSDRFDEALGYGRGPKVELLMRLGIAGQWDGWKHPYWDQMRACPRSPCAGQARPAGFCYRLATGNKTATFRIDARQRARMQGLAGLVAHVDRTT